MSLHPGCFIEGVEPVDQLRHEAVVVVDHTDKVLHGDWSLRLGWGSYIQHRPWREMAVALTQYPR